MAYFPRLPRRRAPRLSCWLPLAALLVAALVPVSAQAQSLIFSEGFNRTTGLGTDWATRYGGYSTDGSYAVSGTPPINGNWSTMTPALGTDDYSVAADITVPTGGSENGVFARSIDPVEIDMTLYALKLNTDGTVRIYRRVQWEWTELASANAGIQANVSYAVKLVVVGSNPVHIEGWVNGTQVIGVDDDSINQLSVGGAGLVAYASGVKYNSFEVRTVPSHLFFDYFNRTTSLGGKWTVPYGSFTPDGSRAVSGTPPSNGNWAKVVPTLGTNDYTVSADITVPSWSLYSGVVARSSISGNFDSDLYAAQISTASGGSINLYRRNNWTWTLLASSAATIVANGTYNVKLLASGSNPVHLEAWLNGSMVLSYNDSSSSRISSGAAGIQNYNSGVKYTSFFVDPVTPSSNVTVNAVLQGAGSGTLTSSPSGISCPGTCSMTVTQGTVVTFSQSPATGSSFGGWSGACTGLTGCSFTANNNQTVFGTFNQNQALLTVSVNGNGSVSSNPTGISCPSDCSMSATYGTSIVLTATPSSGNTFSGWTGACSGTGTCTVNSQSNAKVTANFAVSTPPASIVSVSVSGSGFVTSSPSGINCPGTCSMSVAYGTSVALTATPNSGNSFQGWSGACTGSGGCSFGAYGNKSATATFKANNSYPCGSSPCAYNQWPPASWRPYSDTSPFNRPVPASPRPPTLSMKVNGITKTSSTMMSYLMNTIGTSGRINHMWLALDGRTGWPTYYGRSSDLACSLDCQDWGGTCSPEADTFRVPYGAKVQGNVPNNNSDRHYTFIDQSQTPIKEYDLFGASRSPITSCSTPIPTRMSGYTNVMTGDGRAIGNGEGNAGHVGNLAGRVRVEEFEAAIAGETYIDHALGITIKCTNGVSVYPAGSNPGQTCANISMPNAADAPPMGARLWLDMPDSTIEGMSIPEWKKVILRTLKKYGAIVQDTSSETSYFTIQTESGNQYTSMGASDRWLEFGADRVAEGSSSNWYYNPNGPFDGYTGTWHSTDNGINWNTTVWNNLKILDDCVSDGTCP